MIDHKQSILKEHELHVNFIQLGYIFNISHTLVKDGFILSHIYIIYFFIITVNCDWLEYIPIFFPKINKFASFY